MVQSFLRWLLLRTGWPLARGRLFAPPPATASSPSELSVSSRSLRSSSTSCGKGKEGLRAVLKCLGNASAGLSCCPRSPTVVS